MNRTCVKKVAMCAMCIGMVVPQSALQGAEPAQAKTQPKTHDLALEDGGVIVGLVVDNRGRLVRNAAVSIMHGTHRVARARTNKRGEFRVKGLRPGIHTIAAAGETGVYRFWSDRTAPPQAGAKALLVADERVVRGQCGEGCTCEACSGTNNSLLTGVIVGAIAGTVGGVIGYNIGLDRDEGSP